MKRSFEFTGDHLEDWLVFLLLLIKTGGKGVGMESDKEQAILNVRSLTIRCGTRG